MLDQGKLIEMMQEIRMIAGSQNNHMTQEEISKYLGEELSAEQYRAVYQYLGEHGVKVEGYQYVPIQEETKRLQDLEPVEKTVKIKNPKKKSSGRKNGQNSTGKSREHYFYELRKIEGNLKEEQALILEYVSGAFHHKEQIAKLYLNRVVELAGKYENRPVLMEEVIAEGNVGLMLALKLIEENRLDYIGASGELLEEKFFGTLEGEIVQAMESYIDEMTASKDWEAVLLARTNLLHEATKYMAEEMGREPTLEELSEYTKLDVNEIKRLRELSKS